MQDTEEIWKDIVGYESYYQVSNFGNIRNSTTKLLRKSIPNWANYHRIGLNKKGKYKIHSVHRLVAIAFIPNPNNYPESNHIDHNRQNNNVGNLEWCTRSYNASHSFTRPDRKKARAWLGKKGKLHPNSLPIVQKLNGVVIGSFDGLSDAARKLGIRDTGIGKVCRGERKSYKGYQWEFV